MYNLLARIAKATWLYSQVYLQSTGDQKPEEAEGSAGKNSSDWIVPDLAGKE